MATPPSKTSQLKVLSLGAGAIGTYVGGSLALAGHTLVFLEQARVAEELRQRGLRLDLSVDKRRKAKDTYIVDPSSFVVATSLEEALRYGPFDVVIFALKSFDTASALETIRPLADKLPPFLCLSNGVDNEPALAKALGADKVIYGTVTSAIGRRGPGEIVLERLRGVGIAGTHPLSDRLVAALNDAFLNARAFPDAPAMKWSKMLTNLLANPLSAILDMTAAEIYAHKGLYRVEIAMLRECLAVMAAQGIGVVDLPGTPVRALAFVVKLPSWLSRPVLARAAGAGRGGKMPSFHIDLHSGRGRTEVEYLHGAVVRAGKKAKVPTPVNQFLTNTLLAIAKGEIPLQEYARRPEDVLRQLTADR
ncbi:MAG: ketopantoate reductase family protein [Chloroflexota bacterium]